MLQIPDWWCVFSMPIAFVLVVMGHVWRSRRRQWDVDNGF